MITLSEVIRAELRGSLPPDTVFTLEAARSPGVPACGSACIRPSAPSQKRSRPTGWPGSTTSQKPTQWRRLDSNQGPTDYESAALTN
jgi:hypothetical protein